DRNLVGPLFGCLGGLLVLAGGLLVLAGAFAGRGMGGRFERGPAPAAPMAAASAPAEPEDDAAALWKSLDAGDDPTGEGGDVRGGGDSTNGHPMESPGGQDR
ncbi:MAG: Trp biosynthesis-associated membrane protein, partial [Nakamurella sp.]